MEPHARILLHPDLENGPESLGGFAYPTGISGKLIGLLAPLASRTRNTWVLGLLDIRQNDHVLEIGFGPGVEISRLAEMASRGFIAGIDLSESMLRQATGRNRELIAAGRVELKRASLSAIPYPDNRFDRVVGINSIQFSTDLIHDLFEIRRVLKPEGTVTLAVQPMWKGATDDTTHEVALRLRSAMTDAGFSDLTLFEKTIKPRPVACVTGTKPQ